MQLIDGSHLSYCTNVHPGENWADTFAALRHSLPRIKAGTRPSGDFGVGLRLSAVAARELEQGDNLAEFQDFLAREDLYVFTLNGFPYGPFHGQAVKEQVYQPDWRCDERVEYTLSLARILARLLPDDLEYGSISTVPGAFKPDVRTIDDQRAMAANLGRVADAFAHLEDQTGRRLILALEPEPMCFLETMDEAIAFFTTHLQGDAAQRRHLGLCLDTCHAAVEFEDADTIIDRVGAAGITIAKVQLSSALDIPAVDTAARTALARFSEDTYLHQTVQHRDGSLTRFLDLPQALDTFTANDAPHWRTHFHVPVFREAMEHFGTTQEFLVRILDRHRATPISAHLEVETYTWGVLPPQFRDMDLETGIGRELEWVLERLGD
ncbi:MAG: metabolite traffic protein EboE [Gammaproteobacteria bacterium]